MDNAYGKGYMGGMVDPKTGETVFVYVEGCKVHTFKDPEDPDPED